MALSERLVLAEGSVASPEAFLKTAIRAGIDQGANREREWRSGIRGYGLRAGSAYAENFIAQSIEQSTALLRHEDNRYFASGERGFGRRIGYAISSVFLARRDDGARRFSLSGIAGPAGGAFLSLPWQPPSSSSPADAAVSFGLTLGIRAGFNVLREFAPRLPGYLLR